MHVPSSLRARVPIIRSRAMILVAWKNGHPRERTCAHDRRRSVKIPTGFYTCGKHAPIRYRGDIECVFLIGRRRTTRQSRMKFTRVRSLAREQSSSRSSGARKDTEGERSHSHLEINKGVEDKRRAAEYGRTAVNARVRAAPGFSRKGFSFPYAHGSPVVCMRHCRYERAYISRAELPYRSTRLKEKLAYPN